MVLIKLREWHSIIFFFEGPFINDVSEGGAVKGF